MDRSSSSRWLRAAGLAGIVYPVVGIAFAAPANSAASSHVRLGWRLAAWLVCAAVFAAHLGYEHIRLRSSPLRAALHVALAVAMGAFLLAVWINVHPHRAVPGRPGALLALAVFPAVTGVPAFLVALATAAVLSRVRPSSAPPA